MGYTFWMIEKSKQERAQSVDEFYPTRLEVGAMVDD